MFKLIVEKELHDIIGSTKFALTFGVCAVLILLTFYVGARNYQVSQRQYEAAVAENLRQMEGLTDWLMVRNHRIFLPPQPLAALVTGISNDIGRNIEVRGRGEVGAEDSRYGDDPIFAVFRFLDLDFVFQIVLSLFAILFAYDAICGEKERGTLRLSFANAVPRDKYILGKITGTFLALAIPLLIPILLGSFVLPLLGVPMAGDDWIRLALVILAGLLYFGVFLTLSVFISAMTERSSGSFLLLLVVWIFAVLIVPRTSVLLAGRAVKVPSLDEHASQRARLAAQLWQEDRGKMSNFKPDESLRENPERMLSEFNSFMQKLGDEREQKMQALSKRLNEERRNREAVRERVAFGLARISPAASFSLATTNLVGTSLELKQQYLNAATEYQQAYAKFMKEKTGMLLGGFRIMAFRSNDGEEAKKDPINPREIPPFVFKAVPLQDVFGAALVDLGILALFNLAFFAGAYVAFLRYDVR
jgi:ABC-type transport system involved in multi-copper enzyme maturation permease subunit